MNKILLNKITRASVEAFINSPSHGLVVVGPDGAGKSFLVDTISATLLNLPIDKLPNYAYYIKIFPEADKNQISIEQIRQFVKVKW